MTTLKITKKAEPNINDLICGSFKKWKCPNCKRDRLTESNINTIMCGCGEYYKEIK
jgi:hypothetical protein